MSTQIEDAESEYYSLINETREEPLGSAQKIRDLVSKGVVLSPKDIMRVARLGWTETGRAMILANPNLLTETAKNTHDVYVTALHVGVEAKREEFCEMFLAEFLKKCDPAGLRSPTLATVIQSATLGGPKMIQWALRNGAHPDGVYYDGQSYQASAVVPFDEAIRTPGVAGVEIAQALVNGGANVSNVIVERPGASGGMKFGLHGSPMIHALKAHRFDIANVMMTSSTFNPRATGSNGVNDTILLQAGKVGHLATVNQLVKNGALEGATANDYLNLIKGTSKGLIESSTSSGRSLYTSATEGDPASIERCNEFSAIHKLFVGKLTELYPQELEKMYGMTRSGQRRIRTEFSMCEMRVVPEAVSAAPPARPGEKPPLAQCTL